MQLTTQLATAQCSLKAALLIYQRTSVEGVESGIATVITSWTFKASRSLLPAVT